jgi:Domain of unknown function (DUF4157)
MPNALSGFGLPNFNPARDFPLPFPSLPRSIDDLLGRGLSALEQAVISRTLDGLAGLAKSAGNGIADLADKARGQLAALPNSAANALADSMRGPNARTLTAGETNALRQAFGNSIDLSNVRIVDGPGRNPDAWVAFNVGGNPAITEGNTVDVRSDGYTKDFSKTPDRLNTLLHEFAHVRQYQQMGFGAFFAKYANDLATAGGRNSVYDYGSRPNHFRDETIEGQAAMVGDYAGYRAGQTGNGALNPIKAAAVEIRVRGTGLFGL